MNKFLVSGECGIGSELSLRVAEEQATHLNFATSTAAKTPKGASVSWLPWELVSDWLISSKKAVARLPTDV